MATAFEQYLKSGKVKKKTPDQQEAQALLQQAQERLEYIKNQKIDEKNAKFIFEAAYEAMREAAQSLMSLQGYKPYSHEATVSFIEMISIFNQEDIFQFDHFRKLRSDSVFRAVKIILTDAKESVQFAEKFISQVKIVFSSQK